MQFETTSAALARISVKNRQDKLTILRERWRKALRQSQQADAWGQVVEAVDGYNKLVSSVRSAFQDHSFTDEELVRIISSVAFLFCECVYCIDSSLHQRTTQS
jgi:hypothetical protein